MWHWGFSGRAGGSSGYPSGTGWSLQAFRDRLKPARDPLWREPSRHRAPPCDRHQYDYHDDGSELDYDEEESVPEDYPEEFWTPVNPTSNGRSSSPRARFDSHPGWHEHPRMPSNSLPRGHSPSHGSPGVSSAPQDFYLDDYPSNFRGPVTRALSRGLSRGVVRIPIVESSDRDRRPASHQHGDDSGEEYDNSPQDCRSAGQRLGHGCIPVRFVPLPSSSGYGGSRKSMGVDDVGELGHFFDSLDLGSPSVMFDRAVGGSRIDPDEGFFRGGSRSSPRGDVFGDGRSGRHSFSRDPRQLIDDERTIYDGRLPPGFVTDRRSSSPRRYSEDCIPRAGDRLSTSDSMGIRDIPQDLHIAAGGALISVAPHCAPLVDPPADAICTICLEGHPAPNPLVTPRVCVHPVHVECLNEWVNSAANNATGCPVCRMKIVPQGRRLFAEDTNGTWIPVHRVGQQESQWGPGPDARRAR